MPTKERKLCAPKDKLSSLISLGEDFAKRMTLLTADYKQDGKDTTAIDKQLADLVKRISAHKRALKL